MDIITSQIAKDLKEKENAKPNEPTKVSVNCVTKMTQRERLRFLRNQKQDTMDSTL